MSKLGKFERYINHLCEALGHRDRHGGFADYSSRGLMLPIELRIGTVERRDNRIEFLTRTARFLEDHREATVHADCRWIAIEADRNRTPGAPSSGGDRRERAGDRVHHVRGRARWRQRDVGR